MAKSSVTGDDEFRRKMRQAPDLAMQALKAALFQEQQAIIAEAQAITPVDTGVLRASGTVLPPEEKGSQVSVTAGFGGAAQSYAVPVHERLGVNHPVGQAKFLESSFLERAPRIPANISKRVEKAFERLKK